MENVKINIRGWIDYFYLTNMNPVKLERMAANADVYLEAVEEAKNEGTEPEKTGGSGAAGLQWGNIQLGYWRIAGNAVLQRFVTKEKLVKVDIMILSIVRALNRLNRRRIPKDKYGGVRGRLLN